MAHRLQRAASSSFESFAEPGPFTESRLKKIRQAKAALEAEARTKAEADAAVARQRIEDRERQEAETGKKIGGTPPCIPDPDQAVPDAKAQKNFTDPESRIMKDGATKGFEQAYNVQVAVDATAQVIVATAVTQDANDKRQLVPVLSTVQANLGRLPENTSADNGYFSADVMSDARLAGTSLHIAPGREKANDAGPPEANGGGETLSAGVKDLASTTVADAVPDSGDVASPGQQMRAKLRTVAGHAIYKMRKAIVEPVFGQIKQVRGFRQFSFRGLTKVTGEWDFVSLTHNLLKLFRSGWRPDKGRRVTAEVGSEREAQANQERGGACATARSIGLCLA